MASAKVNRERLQREMLLRGWDGIDLAFHARVSPATVSHALRGLPVSTTTIRKLALALSNASVIAGAEDLLA
jgi:transcriptional regulator with XRE-family HTH domain